MLFKSFSVIQPCGNQGCCLQVPPFHTSIITQQWINLESTKKKKEGSDPVEFLLIAHSPDRLPCSKLKSYSNSSLCGLTYVLSSYLRIGILNYLLASKFLILLPFTSLPQENLQTWNVPNFKLYSTQSYKTPRVFFFTTVEDKFSNLEIFHTSHIFSPSLLLKWKSIPRVYNFELTYICSQHVFIMLHCALSTLEYEIDRKKKLQDFTLKFSFVFFHYMMGTSNQSLMCTLHQ